MIPIGKIVPNGKTIKAEITGLDIRQNGIYLMHGSDGVGGMTFLTDKYGDGYLTVIAQRPTGFGGTNNDCASTYIAGKLVVK